MATESVSIFCQLAEKDAKIRQLESEIATLRRGKAEKVETSLALNQFTEAIAVALERMVFCLERGDSPDDDETFNQLISRVMSYKLKVLNDVSHSIDIDQYGWELWRQDALGNKTLIEKLATKTQALSKQEDLEGRSCKHVYWIQPAGPGERVVPVPIRRKR